MNPLFVTMYTPMYEGEMRQLRRTIDAHALELFAIEIESRGSWIANVQQKAVVIWRMLEMYQTRPIVWLDADARVKLYPDLLMKMSPDTDFAAYFIPDVFKNTNKRPWGPERSPEALAGGTMYFGNTGPARMLVSGWIAECQCHPRVWEQQNLQRMVGKMLDNQDVDFHYGRLPQSYCKVFDHKWFPGEEGPTVIEHTQASRRLKRKVT